MTFELQPSQEPPINNPGVRSPHRLPHRRRTVGDAERKAAREGEAIRASPFQQIVCKMGLAGPTRHPTRSRKGIITCLSDFLSQRRFWL